MKWHRNDLSIVVLFSVVIGLGFLSGCSDDNGYANTPNEIKFLFSGDNGPGFWGELKEDWHECGSGVRQSPINIQDTAIDQNLTALDLDLHETPLYLINRGYDIMERYEEGSTLIFEGVSYTLLQFHYHTFSEHTILGARGVMEVHVVFINEELGQYAVIGMLYDIGTENDFLKIFDDRLPTKSGETVIDDAVNLNAADMFTDTSSYYTYEGSLTTPPCASIVTWIVLKENAQLSEAQYQAFRRILGNNFRPLQPLDGRTIWETP